MTSNLPRRDEALRVRIRQVALEVRIADHLSQIRASLGMTEQGFGEENNEGLSIITVDLAAKNVEVVGRCASKDISSILSITTGILTSGIQFACCNPDAVSPFSRVRGRHEGGHRTAARIVLDDRLSVQVPDHHSREAS